MSHLTRRDFLKLSALSAGGAAALVALRPFEQPYDLPEFPQAERLGRVCRPFSKVDVKARPDYDSDTVKVLYEDSVVPWLREVVGKHQGRNNQRFVETPDGYIWSADLQPVRNQLNQPLEGLPDFGQGKGMWVQVTVPYVDFVMDNPPVRSPILKGGGAQRLYYSQVVYADKIKKDDNGQIWYRINERYGSYGDIFWVPGETMRVLTPDDLAPIHPEVEDKLVVVNVDWKQQTLSCFEGKTEVYFCTISSGVVQGATPAGEHTIWRKLVSVHMSGGTTGGGYDLIGIGWTTLFVGEGVAIHSTFWHNNFGEPESHGCVNSRPQDAQWIWRWTRPAVPYEPGDVTISGAGSSKVKVIEG